MAQLISLRANDDHVLTAWSSAPPRDCNGGIIVLHAVYGLTNHIGDVCDKWAASGFHAIAPALFDRLNRNIVHPYGRAGADAGTASYNKLTRQQLLSDIAACRDALAASGLVAMSGFCTGGSWSWTAAAHMRFSALVVFYGSHIHQRLGEQPLCPAQLHYGSSDHVVSRGDLSLIKDACPSVEMHLYDGAGHAFMNPEQEFFDASSSAIAWGRAVEFVARSFASERRPFI